MSAPEDTAEAAKKAQKWLQIVQSKVAAPQSVREINDRPLDS